MQLSALSCSFIRFKFESHTRREMTIKYYMNGGSGHCAAFVNENTIQMHIFLCLPEYLPLSGMRWTKTWSRIPAAAHWWTFYPFCIWFSLDLFTNYSIVLKIILWVVFFFVGPPKMNVYAFLLLLLFCIVRFVERVFFFSRGEARLLFLQSNKYYC